MPIGHNINTTLWSVWVLWPVCSYACNAWNLKYDFQVLERGHFTTVWQGKYQGSTVAIKVFPADRKHRFSSEKEIFQLPLMKHAGIVHFLGTGWKPDSSSLIVLQFAEYVSGNHLLKGRLQLRTSTNYSVSDLIQASSGPYSKKTPNPK